jgi:hypothetical protein
MLPNAIGAATEVTAPGLHQVQEVPALLIQLSLRFIAFPIDCPSASAPRASAEPIIPRINAYSAAEAPDWSFSILMNIVIEIPFGVVQSYAYLQVELPGDLMQLEARFIEFAIVLPRASAARAIAEPTIARMRAYSAADAPDSSFSIRMKVVIVLSPSTYTRAPPWARISRFAWVGGS